MEIHRPQSQQTGRGSFPDLDEPDAVCLHQTAAQGKESPVHFQYPSGADGEEVLVAEELTEKSHTPPQGGSECQHGSRRRYTKGQQFAQGTQLVHQPVTEILPHYAAQVLEDRRQEDQPHDANWR